jgi:glycosyltransferase involved in cell wall biosynthesis
MEPKMLDDVWIYVFTFNHEKYIIQCLTGIIKQKHRLSIKVIIIDDHSSDRTIELATNFLNNSAVDFMIKRNKFRYFRLWHKKLSRDRLNLIIKSDCKYIATIDGDDYFNSENKIQKQFDFMQQNVTTSISFHSYTIFNETSSQFGHTIPNIIDASKLANKSYRDLKYGIFAGSPTIMLRNIDLKFIPRDLHKYYGHGKYVFLWALHGNVSYISGINSIYRVHNNNSYANLNSRKKNKINRKNRYLLNKWINLFENRQHETN